MLLSYRIVLFLFLDVRAIKFRQSLNMCSTVRRSVECGVLQKTTTTKRFRLSKNERQQCKHKRACSLKYLPKNRTNHGSNALNGSEREIRSKKKKKTH